MREILAPDGLLKDILSTFAFMLSVLYEAPKNVMAFTRNRSIVDNAREHCGHNYVLNLDLKDFFTTIVASDVERGLRRLGSLPMLQEYSLAFVHTLVSHPAVVS